MLFTDIRIAVRSGLGRDGEGVRGFVELGEAGLISVSDDDNRDDQRGSCVDRSCCDTPSCNGNTQDQQQRTK